MTTYILKYKYTQGAQVYTDKKEFTAENYAVAKGQYDAWMRDQNAGEAKSDRLIFVQFKRK